MNCPCCKDTLLQMSERLEIEIDYCPKCRGVWLDRGELDKIIEKNQQKMTPANNITHYNTPNNEKEYYKEKDYYRENKYKRKKSFLEEIFD